MKVLLTALNAHYMHTSLAIRQLKAACRDLDGIEAELCELHINLPYRRVLGDIARKKPDAIGFSCYIWNIGYVEELIAECHKVMPGVPIWLGGPEVSYDAEDMLKKHPELTGILVGEGEETDFWTQ